MIQYIVVLSKPEYNHCFMLNPLLKNQFLSSMSTQKIIYLIDSHFGHVICKKCGKTKTFDVGGMNLSRDYKVTCKKCNRSFHVRFEARRHYRKKTNLSGIFVTKDGLMGSAKIVDISQTGIGFRTIFKYSNVIKGMNIRLSFRLDNHKRTEIMLGGEAMNRKGKLIGVRITDMEEHIKHDIGSYMTPSI